MIKSLFLLAALLAACSWAITCPAPYSACGTSRCYNSAIQCCKQPGDVIGSKGSGECPTDIASGCQLPFTGCGPNLCYDDDTQCCVFSNNIYSVADKTSPLCGGNGCPSGYTPCGTGCYNPNNQCCVNGVIGAIGSNFCGALSTTCLTPYALCQGSSPQRCYDPTIHCCINGVVGSKGSSECPVVPP